ncbi:MAG: hypothetical protein B6U78_00410 [Candidatus Aenigmarchaeota archaeon ex4484_224]|nr:MAG: hypothetical protein B6U78_00410 [Candidatus Aenigmarchaeota archaeon ex4484_224]
MNYKLFLVPLLLIALVISFSGCEQLPLIQASKTTQPKTTPSLSSQEKFVEVSLVDFPDKMETDMEYPITIQIENQMDVDAKNFDLSIEEENEDYGLLTISIDNPPMTIPSSSLENEVELTGTITTAKDKEGEDSLIAKVSYDVEQQIEGSIAFFNYEYYKKDQNIREEALKTPPIKINLMQNAPLVVSFHLKKFKSKERAGYLPYFYRKDQPRKEKLVFDLSLGDRGHILVDGNINKVKLDAKINGKPCVDQDGKEIKEVDLTIYRHKTVTCYFDPPEFTESKKVVGFSIKLSYTFQEEKSYPFSVEKIEI